MNNIIISWNKDPYIDNLSDEIFQSKLKSKKIVNVIGDDSFKHINDSIRTFLYKEIYYDAPSTGYANYNQIEKMEMYESNIFRVISRNFRSGRKDDSYINIYNYYHKILAAIDGLVIEQNLEIALFFDTPHHPFDYILYLYFKVNSKKIFVTRRLPFPHSGLKNHHRFITSDFPYLDKCFQAKYIDRMNTIMDKSEYSNFVNMYLQEYAPGSKPSYNSQHLGTRWSFRFITSHIAKRSIAYFLKGEVVKGIKKIFIYFERLSLDRFKRYKLLEYYEKNTQKVNLDLDYIYFPLQFQPEASTTPLGYAFSNLELAIDYLLFNSKDILIYVREHPSFWHNINNNDRINDVRTIEFYQRISSDVRVRLVSQKQNHLELVEKSRLVATVTGTVAIEAFGFSKMVLLFGEYIYGSFANTIKCPSNEALSFLNSSFNGRVNLRREFICTLLALEGLSMVMNLSPNDRLETKAVLEYAVDYIKRNTP